MKAAQRMAPPQHLPLHFYFYQPLPTQLNSVHFSFPRSVQTRPAAHAVGGRHAVQGDDRQVQEGGESREWRLSSLLLWVAAVVAVCVVGIVGVVVGLFAAAAAVVVMLATHSLPCSFDMFHLETLLPPSPSLISTNCYISSHPRR